MLEEHLVVAGAHDPLEEVVHDAGQSVSQSDMHAGLPSNEIGSLYLSLGIG